MGVNFSTVYPPMENGVSAEPWEMSCDECGDCIDIDNYNDMVAHDEKHREERRVAAFDWVPGDRVKPEPYLATLPSNAGKRWGTVLAVDTRGQVSMEWDGLENNEDITWHRTNLRPLTEEDEELAKAYLVAKTTEQLPNNAVSAGLSVPQWTDDPSLKGEAWSKANPSPTQPPAPMFAVGDVVRMPSTDTLTVIAERQLRDGGIWSYGTEDVQGWWTEKAFVYPSDAKRPDMVNHPPHYKQGQYEVIDVLEAFFPNDPLLWQVGKYIMRAGKKGDAAEDLKKAAWYLARRIEQLDA